MDGTGVLPFTAPFPCRIAMVLKMRLSKRMRDQLARFFGQSDIFYRLSPSCTRPLSFTFPPAELQSSLSSLPERTCLLQLEGPRPSHAQLGHFTPTATVSSRARATAVSWRPGSSFAPSSCRCSLPELSNGPDPRFVAQKGEHCGCAGERRRGTSPFGRGRPCSDLRFVVLGTTRRVSAASRRASHRAGRSSADRAQR